MRVFASIEPEEELLSSIYEFVNSHMVGRIRVVEKNKLHITLLFMGSVKGTNLEAFSKAIGSEHFSKFDICFKGFDVFTHSNPKVLFANVAEGAAQLGEIHDKLASMASECGIEFDSKQFAPHLTVGRFLGRVNRLELEEFLSSFSDKEFGCFTCRCIKLKKSEFFYGKSFYSDIYVKDFGN